jgi:hypothetical protein
MRIRIVALTTATAAAIVGVSTSSVSSRCSLNTGHGQVGAYSLLKLPVLAVLQVMSRRRSSTSNWQS